MDAPPPSVHPGPDRRVAPAELAGPFLVLGQVARAAEEEEAPQHHHGDDREHAGRQVRPADRPRADRGEEPAQRRLDDAGLAEQLGRWRRSGSAS